MEHLNRLRRSSFTPSFGFGSSSGTGTTNSTAPSITHQPPHPKQPHPHEPVIVVEESGADDDGVALELASLKSSTPRESLDIDSPVNPYLLSPWRDARETRKHSLPTQQVTDGITASQVRRLSERGGEGSGPTPKEAAFLATLSQAPQPSGRRHSVVTISKAPVFGRGCRRESVAAYPLGSRGSLFSSRRDSAASTAASVVNATGGPPATDPIGSHHNLQLDIMDDIIQTRKARMKLWNTSSEKVCEVQTLDEAGTSTPKRYTNRRYSDFVGSTLAPIPSNRRASENILSPAVAAIAANANQPSPSSGSSMAANFLKKSGIVVTKNDLISLMSSLTSSANEINRIDDEDEPVPTPTLQSFAKKPAFPEPSTSGTSAGASASLLAPEQIGMSRSNRSNSFDVSILHNAKAMISGSGSGNSGSAAEKNAAALTGWFEKRHQPMARKKSMRPSCAATVSFSKDVLDRFKDKEAKSTATAAGSTGAEKKPRSKLRWDNKGSFVDPHVIGNAIEGFLRKGTGRSTRESRAKKAAGSGGGSSSSSGGSSARASFWFGKAEEDDSKDTCESSLCSTLKDLFVK